MIEAAVIFFNKQQDHLVLVVGFVAIGPFGRMMVTVSSDDNSGASGDNSVASGDNSVAFDRNSVDIEEQPTAACGNGTVVPSEP